MGFARGPPLFLPQGNPLFYAVDRLTASGERLISMRGARCYANRDVSDLKLTNPMNRREPDRRMLGHDAFEHALHLLERKAFVCLVVESSHVFALSIVAHHAGKDANPARPPMRDGLSHLIEGDFSITDPTEDDRSSTRDGGQQVNAVPVTDLLGIVDEITIDGESHALKEVSDRRIALGYSSTKVDLRNGRGRELEGRSLAACEFTRRGIVVDTNLHGRT